MVKGRFKFFIGGLLVLAAVIFLLITSTQANVEYFMTVEELATQGNSIEGKNLRLSGAVVGNTIEYDPDNSILTFEIAHVPGDNDEIEAQGGLAQVLHYATIDPMLPRQKVSYIGVKPDLLQNEAQAIITGHLGEDGIFYAEELLLKCPTKYEEALPEQVIGS